MKSIRQVKYMPKVTQQMGNQDLNLGWSSSATRYCSALEQLPWAVSTQSVILHK